MDKTSYSGAVSRLESIANECQDRWPALRLPVASVVAHFEHVGMTGDEPPAYASDVYLAFACTQGDRAALGVLEAMLGEVPRYVRALSTERPFLDELLQDIRDKLLVGAVPKLLGYRGHGPLAAWLRAFAMRTAVHQRRRGLRTALKQREFRAEHVASDPEADRLRASERRSFACALEAALADLRPDEREILHQHYIDERTLDDLALLYDVHRATVARRISRARRRVFTLTAQAASASEPGLRAIDDPMMADVETDLSVARILAARRQQ